MEKLSPSEERALILALKSGSNVALEKIYRLYAANLVAYSRMFLKSSGLCEEIVHDVFLKYWEHKHTLQEDQPIKPYLYAICKNHILNAIRSLLKDERQKVQWIMENSVQEEPIPDESDLQRCRELAYQAISQLPQQRQLVFKLCKLEGKSYDEVASILKISKGTINDHIIKANKSIRQHLQSQSGLSYHLALAVIFFL